MHIKGTFLYTLLTFIILFNVAPATMGQIGGSNSGLKVGNLKVYKLQDAQIYLQTSLLSGIKQDEAKRLAGGVDSVLTPVNAYLVQTPEHLVLVDAGIGKYPGEDSGHLPDLLKNAGVDPSDIDLILITHFHFDHIGGLITPEGKKLFPNAVVRASKAESDFWLNDASMLPENLQERSAKIKANLAPYISTKSYIPFLPDEEPGKGIRVLSAHGHTAGHTVYAFSSAGNELWCIGDLIHFGLIQFSHPLVGIAFDNSSQLAISSRIDFFKRAAESHIILAGAHLPEMVRLEKDGDAFIATPARTY